MSSWKSFLQSRLKENISILGPSATYASLATVTQDNKPAVRTVVIRGYAGEHHKEQTGWESDLLIIHTNKHSNKVKELYNNKYTEINWYMNGTMEQFRIGGTIDVIEKNTNGTTEDVRRTHKEEQDKSLALQSFLKQQGDQSAFSWQAERLRQFVQLSANMRADMVSSQRIKELAITRIDDTTGWFINQDAQELLEEAFENFTLLVVKVTSVKYWSPSTGLKSVL